MPKTILIADDAISMRMLVSLSLKGKGYDVIEAEDGMDAIAKLKGKKVDLIISDLNMPKMDGITFIKTVKATQEYKFVPIIMLTTESQAEKKELGRQAGAKAWIVKPFKPDALLDVVKKIVG